MADKVEKPKKSKAKPKKDEKGVLAALPSTRPERIGTRRASAPKTFEQPEAAKAGASAAKRSAAKPTAAPAKKSSAKPAAARKPSKKPSTPRATATRRKAAAPGTFEPTEAAETAAGAADERAAGIAIPLEPAPEPRPRAVREAAPGIGTSGKRRQAPASAEERSEAQATERGRPSGVELVTTAVQAAGELTQIGLTIGGQIIKRAVDRLPRP